MRKRTVVVGQLGLTLDSHGGRGEKRWSRWRPSVAVCQQEDLLVDRYVLMHPMSQVSLARQVQQDIATISPETTVELHVVEYQDPWDFEEVFTILYDFARDLALDPEQEDTLMHITTGTHVAQICTFLLTESRHFPGKLLQTSPAPRKQSVNTTGSHAIIDLDLSRYDAIATRFSSEQQEALDFLKSGIATANVAFNNLIANIERVAIRSVDPILLMGPTGAGKSQLARRIYELKRQRLQVLGPFVELNCATLRGDAAMSALFGHVTGAFTGASKDRPGLLRAADGGILFLDEIGELGSDEQAMLLRAVEEKVFLPVGGDHEISSDFQLIVGTHRELRQEVERGKFREDLLARINLWTFVLPALADRREDIEPNLDYELERFAERKGERVTFNREARERFLRFANSPQARWRGNFRDLNAAVIRMATLAPKGRIGDSAVQEEIARLQFSWRGEGPVGATAKIPEKLQHVLEDLDLFDRVQLLEVMRVCRRSHSLSEAGRILFQASRVKKKSSNDADRLRKYLARFQLDWIAVMES